jgi:uncharacterized protein (DUF1501 family)
MKRRTMIHGLGALAAAAGADATLGRLDLIGAALAAAKTAPSDYRALVCLFLFGGNDGFNLLVPMDAARYTPYANARGDLSVPIANLLPIEPDAPAGAPLGLNPGVPALRDLFAAGRLSFISDVGTLVEPTERSGYFSGQTRLPPQLYSHNDQQEEWMRGSANNLDAEGWGGRVADLLHAAHNSGTVPMNVSLFGSNLLQVGRSLASYDLTVDGVVPLMGFQPFLPRVAARRQAFNALLALVAPTSGSGHPHLMVREYARRQRQARELEGVVTGALNQAPAFAAPFPNGNLLAMQLRQIARLIAVGPSLGLSRQIFFAGLGGFDTHAAQATDLPPLLATLNGALGWFDAALGELGARGRVTTFTASDFGRTLTRNQTGTDHGWSNHQLVMGGAIRGRRVFGTLPDFAAGGPRDAGEGRLIPTTSSDQLHASLATWLGVAAPDLATVFPNLSNFPGGALPLFAESGHRAP